MGNLNRLKEVVSSYPESEQKRVKIVHHDLKAELNPEISATIGKIDYISHLAAGSHVDRSITFPLEFVMDNVVGTAHILDYARKIDSLKDLHTLAQMKFLVLLLQEYFIKKTIDITQQIHIQLQRLVLKSLL